MKISPGLAFENDPFDCENPKTEKEYLNQISTIKSLLQILNNKFYNIKRVTILISICL